MESYLKEEDPVSLEWLEKSLGWLEKVDDNKILNLSVVRSIYLNYSDFQRVVHLPNNKKSFESLDSVLESFIEECNNDLSYFLSTEIDHENKTVNIFVLPVVESA